MKMKGCILNTKPDLEGITFSLECLREMASKAGEVPFMIFFHDEIGKAFNFSVDEGAGELLCECETLNDNVNADGLVPVIGYTYRDIDDYNSYEIRTVSLTDKPASVGTWIEPVENE